MNCAGCGAGIQPGFAFCPACGMKQPKECARCGYSCDSCSSSCRSRNAIIDLPMPFQLLSASLLTPSNRVVFAISPRTPLGRWNAPRLERAPQRQGAGTWVANGRRLCGKSDHCPQRGERAKIDLN